MRIFRQTLCLVCLNFVAGKLLRPKFRESPEPQNVEMPEISDMDIKEAFDHARNQTIKKTETEKAFVNNGHNPSQTVISNGLRMLAPVPKETMDLNRIQEELEWATKFIAAKYNLTPDQTKLGLPKKGLPEDESTLQECKKLQEVTCKGDDKYRTADGSCNNLENKNWGRSQSWYGVMIGQDFADGLSSPREGKGICKLPNSRFLSAKVLTDVNVPAKNYNLMTLMWGQFIAHDVGLISSVEVDGTFINCCPSNTSTPSPPSCFPIDTTNDTFYSEFGFNCMDFQRAAVISYGCKLGVPRRAINQQTSFIDGSIIYGMNDETMSSLRTYVKGGLKHQESRYGPLLPESDVPEYDQCSTDNNTCFRSGDPRVNSQPSLLTIHTIMSRFHDHIAGKLAANYPAATDEKLFQESRRIVGAVMQAITFGDYLRHVLGGKFMKFFKPNVTKTGNTEYNSELDPTVTTEFSTGAYRFGHSLAQNAYTEVGQDGKVNGQLPLKDNFFRVDFVKQGRMDDLLRGLFRQRAQTFDRHFVGGISNHLFEVPGKGFGFDLVAYGIQRGRDTGLPSYTDLLEYCYDVKVNSFDDLRKLGIISEDNLQVLEKAYGSECVRDMDMYTAGFSEMPIEGGIVGPTAACIIGKQYQGFRDGDRYFYSHTNQSGSFSEGQLKELRKSNLARIVCDMSQSIKTILPDVFGVESCKNKMTPCNEIEAPDFNKWFDK